MKIILSFIFFKKFILSFINVVIHKLCDSGTVILNTSCTSKRFWLDFIFIRIWNILRVSYCVSSKSSWEFIRKKNLQESSKSSFCKSSRISIWESFWCYLQNGNTFRSFPWNIFQNSSICFVFRDFQRKCSRNSLGNFSCNSCWSFSSKLFPKFLQKFRMKFF